MKIHYQIEKMKPSFIITFNQTEYQKYITLKFTSIKADFNKIIGNEIWI